MNHGNTRVVTAFYETRAAADAHKRQLEALGIPSTDIAIVDGADTTISKHKDEDKGFFEAIGDFFMGEEDQDVYNEGLRRGGCLLTARVSEAQYTQVLDALDTDDAVDMDERTRAWRADGWEAAPVRAVADKPVDGKIEVMEENLRVGKRDVSHGRVRVRSYIVEDQVSEDVTLHSEHVEVERRPVDRAVEPGTDAFRERTLEAEETAQEAVVSKEARVVEEIGLKKHADSDTKTVTETVRHTEVDVDDGRDATIRKD